MNQDRTPMGLVPAIDIGGTKVAGAILRYGGDGECPQVAWQDQVPTSASEGGEAVLGRVIELAERMVREAQAIEGGEVLGIGIGSAGRISAYDGSVVYANEIMPGWTGQPLGEAVAERCGLTVTVLNDVQAYALGEARWGAAHGARNAIMVAAGTGLGGAIIADGRVLRGTHGFAGELGHTMNVLAAGITCACGSTGHLESIASGSGIEARYAELTGETLTGAQISERAGSGEHDALKVIGTAGEALGMSIASWANMIDPELVIVSGSVTSAGQVWHDAMVRGFLDNASPDARGLPIVDGVLGGRAPLIGAAEHLLDVLGY